MYESRDDGDICTHGRHANVYTKFVLVATMCVCVRFSVTSNWSVVFIRVVFMTHCPSSCNTEYHAPPPPIATYWFAMQLMCIYDDL